ncbi:staygreen family protein [Sporosarcina sp. 179-K 3D1 HS]
MPPATFAQPVEGRKYTLTHSDRTAELFFRYWICVQLSIH